VCQLVAKKAIVTKIISFTGNKIEKEKNMTEQISSMRCNVSVYKGRLAASTNISNQAIIG
jgi:hypothetical protein